MHERKFMFSLLKGPSINHLKYVIANACQLFQACKKFWEEMRSAMSITSVDTLQICSSHRPTKVRAIFTVSTYKEL